MEDVPGVVRDAEVELGEAREQEGETLNCQHAGREEQHEMDT